MLFCVVLFCFFLLSLLCFVGEGWFGLLSSFVLVGLLCFGLPLLCVVLLSLFCVVLFCFFLLSLLCFLWCGLVWFAFFVCFGRFVMFWSAFTLCCFVFFVLCCFVLFLFVFFALFSLVRVGLVCFLRLFWSVCYVLVCLYFVLF